MITQAVFPVAGLGTRFLPATKASPKEMLPIVDKPLIQYAVEEAIASGITQLIFVTSSSKRAIEDHFDSNYELESKLEQRGEVAMLASIRNILPAHVNCTYIRQPNHLGLGHAILCAAPLLQKKPFAVLLADDLIVNAVPCLDQMIRHFQEKKHSIIAVERIPQEQTHQYGIIGYDHHQDSLYTINRIVEKPKQNPPSNLSVVGRYVLTPSIFRCLSQVIPDQHGEIQLTDALAQLLHQETVYGYTFSGTRYDCGNKLGYVQAIVAFGAQHHEIGTKFKDYLKSYQSIMTIKN